MTLSECCLQLASLRVFTSLLLLVMFMMAAVMNLTARR